MNAGQFAQIINMIDDSFIEEAEEYGKENIESLSEIPAEPQKKRNLYYIIPAAAACAALCLAVNHFTEQKIPEKPEIDNSAVTETTTSSESASDTASETTESERSAAVSSEVFSEISNTGAGFLTSDSESKTEKNTGSHSRQTEIIYVSSASQSYSETEHTTSFSNQETTKITETVSVTTRKHADSEAGTEKTDSSADVSETPEYTAEITSAASVTASHTNSSSETNGYSETSREETVTENNETIPEDLEITEENATIYMKAEYKGKKYKFHNIIKADISSGTVITAKFMENPDNESVRNLKAYLIDSSIAGLSGDDVILLKYNDSDDYLLYIISD